MIFFKHDFKFNLHNLQQRITHFHIRIKRNLQNLLTKSGMKSFDNIDVVKWPKVN